MSSADQRARAEARSSPRRRTMLSAVIYVNDVDPGYACRVRDISDGGARLEVSEASWLPQRFVLAIHGQNRRRSVEVAWRGDTSIGVAFRS